MIQVSVERFRHVRTAIVGDMPGKIHIPHRHSRTIISTHPLPRFVLVRFRLFDAIAVSLVRLVVSGVILGLGHDYRLYTDVGTDPEEVE